MKVQRKLYRSSGRNIFRVERVKWSAAGYCVEYYDDPTKYENGTQDENYYCEIWIPVKKK